MKRLIIGGTLLSLIVGLIVLPIAFPITYMRSQCAAARVVGRLGLQIHCVLDKGDGQFLGRAAIVAMESCSGDERHSLLLDIDCMTKRLSRQEHTTFRSELCRSLVKSGSADQAISIVGYWGSTMSTQEIAMLALSESDSARMAAKMVLIDLQNLAHEDRMRVVEKMICAKTLCSDVMADGLEVAIELRAWHLLSDRRPTIEKCAESGSGRPQRLAGLALRRLDAALAEHK